LSKYKNKETDKVESKLNNPVVSEIMVHRVKWVYSSMETHRMATERHLPCGIT